MENYFKVMNLCCGYDQAFSLKDISLSLPKGVLAGIIGPNGAGKTTFFKGITGE
jgi:ABC-type Mn2+/Zn2+ transport system ATPase subunit